MVDVLTSNSVKTSTYEFLINKINREGTLHFSLIDPDPTKQNPSKAGRIALYAEQAGTDAILIGGSTVFDQKFVDETIQAIKDKVSLPIIIFPGGVANLSKKADAILFMSILNSEDPYFIVGQQAIASYTVKLSNLEIMSTGYLIIEPGGTAGWISKAKLLPRNKPKLTTAYALAAEYFGFKLIYLEAGSGSESIPAEIIRLCSSLLSIPIIVGGGVSSKEDARVFVEAGADVIVMGTFLENQVLKDNGNSLKTIIDEIKDAGKENKKNYCLK
ncbi:MAG: phosphoglycerol geranylgeranyltransferase [Promethearchaeota archaeon]|jgi:phosphoglycerol geranylgeranyltransferase